MTELERYEICAAALSLIQHAQLDTDDGPGDRLRDCMDGIWHAMLKEQAAKPNKLKLPSREFIYSVMMARSEELKKGIRRD
jgi:hypothetical protein